jgi:hypothetical protein
MAVVVGISFKVTGKMFGCPGIVSGAVLEEGQGFVRGKVVFAEADDPTVILNSQVCFPAFFGYTGTVDIGKEVVWLQFDGPVKIRERCDSVPDLEVKASAVNVIPIMVWIELNRRGKVFEGSVDISGAGPGFGPVNVGKGIIGLNSEGFGELFFCLFIFFLTHENVAVSGPGYEVVGVVLEAQFEFASSMVEFAVFDEHFAESRVGLGVFGSKGEHPVEEFALGLAVLLYPSDQG